MATSSSSVVILMVLIFSILFKGMIAFNPPLDDVKQKIEALQAQLAELKTVPENETEDAKEDREFQIEDATFELDELQSYYQSCQKSFVSKPLEPDARKSGIGPALMGSIWVCAGCAIFFLPLGIGTAIFLEEFRPNHRALRFFVDLLQLNISNLAGVPSIVYGILGLTVFANMFGLFGNPAEPYLELGTQLKRQYITEGQQVVFIPVQDREEIPELTTGREALRADGTTVKLHVIDIDSDEDDPEDPAVLAVTLYSDNEGGIVTDNAWYSFQLPFGRSVLAASLTLMLVILPVVIIATQEALRSVPSSLRQGALGLGCTRWQVVRSVTLPSAIPGIMTGSILAMSRAIGEAAPILMISGIVSIAAGPKHLMDDFAILPLQIYNWAGLPIDPQQPMNFQHTAAGAIIVLLLVLFAFNSVAITIRQIAQKRLT